MKNIKKLFGIIALVSVIAVSFAACDLEDPGNDDVQKSLVITGIPVTALPTTATASPTTTDVTGKKITVALCNQKGGTTGKGKGDFLLYAYNQVTLGATGSVDIALISNTTKEQFTGTGKYYVLLYFDIYDTSATVEDDITYSYTAQVGGSVPLTYDIQEAKTTIEFNKFALLQ